MEGSMVIKERCLSQILQVLFFSLILITLFSGFAFAQTVILNQVPNQSNAYADNSSDSQVVADNFILSSAATVTQIKIWGIYFSSNTPGTDNFTVIFHTDSGGLPGTVISTQNNVPVTHQLTGGPPIVGYTEYVFNLTLATPVALTPGTYWVEIYNDVTGSNDHFYWETGTVDPSNGIAGFAVAHTLPGSNWANNPGELAIEITKESPVSAVPIMNEWGMIIFMVPAGIGAVYYLRRQRRVRS
jgi:hypothetical protein